MTKPSLAKIQPNWILQFVTLIKTMGSVVFIWGPFEVELAARPITILSSCFALDKVKIEWRGMTILNMNIKDDSCKISIENIFFKINLWQSNKFNNFDKLFLIFIEIH